MIKPLSCRVGKEDLESQIQNTVISLKRFLLIEQCPPAWKHLDLYLFRDDDIAFYVGQSQLAFSRVWDHLLGGFHGHSMIGRFIWCNWPVSMKFSIEFSSSRSEKFQEVGNDLNAAERFLIREWAPCFNISQNVQPTPLPVSYLPPNAPFRRRRSLTTLIREAERAVKIEDTHAWLDTME